MPWMTNQTASMPVTITTKAVYDGNVELTVHHDDPNVDLGRRSVILSLTPADVLEVIAGLASASRVTTTTDWVLEGRLCLECEHLPFVERRECRHVRQQVWWSRSGWVVDPTAAIVYSTRAKERQTWQTGAVGFRSAVEVGAIGAGSGPDRP